MNVAGLPSPHEAAADRSACPKLLRGSAVEMLPLLAVTTSGMARAKPVGVRFSW
jgi:hypothetical protein